MGFFSWITQDTKKSISNHYSTRGTFTVYMLDNKGNVYQEPFYEGYGVLGGKDYYELMAEMNGLSDREEAIKLYYNPKESTLFPNLVENPKKWEWKNEKPKDCFYQGYFY